MTFDFPIAGIVGALLAAGVIFTLRKVERLALSLICLAVVSIAAAAGGAHIHWQRSATVLVMVDQSASTRTAAYHDRDRLNARITELLPNASVRRADFSDPSAAFTQWQPPDAEAVLLFSDGQFELPNSIPPTFVVLDPTLTHSQDAAVASIARSSSGSTIATIRNGGEPRTATCGRTTSAIPTGGKSIICPDDAAAEDVHVNSADAWPENDALPMPPADTAEMERWWIGNEPPASWKSVAAPTRLEPFASAAVVAVDPSTQLSPVQQEQLRSYVTALGGGLILLNPSSPTGNALADLSPLTFEAPTPARRWIILIDCSGSMGQTEGSATRFEAACSAARAMTQILPRNDQAAVAGFARDLKWWLSDTTIADARTATLPPTPTTPSGPTNLEPLLLELLTRGDVDPTTTLIVITDSDAPISNPAGLRAALTKHPVSLDVLSIDAANPALAEIANMTGGKVMTSNNLAALADSAENLARSISQHPAKLATIAFADDLHLPPRNSIPVTSAWLREGAQSLAPVTQNEPAAAEWPRGNGRTIAVAFNPTDAELSALADRVARQPADPRIQIRLDSRQLLIDASNLPDCNRRHFTMRFDADAPRAFAQIAPGRYSAAITPSLQSRVAVVELDSAVIRRIVIPAHYALEFDAIGTNLPRLQAIASRSGGSVIAADDVTPIRLPLVRRDLSLAAPLATLGAASLLLAALQRKL